MTKYHNIFDVIRLARYFLYLPRKVLQIYSEIWFPDFDSEKWLNSLFNIRLNWNWKKILILEMILIMTPICINTIVKVIFTIIWPLKMVSVILQEWAFNQTSTCIPIKSFEMPSGPLNFTYEWNCLIIFDNGFWIQKGRNNLVKGVYYAFMMRILFKIISYELFNKDRCPYLYNHVTKLRVWLWKHLWDILYLFLRIDVINSHFHK